MGYVMSIDAGNSKTIALVACTDGTVAGYGRSGCGDIYGASRAEAAIGAIVASATMAAQQAGVSSEDLLTCVVSAAGADWPEDFAYLQAKLKQAGLCASPLVVNDAIGALRAGSPDGTGVVVAVGTGAATGARSADGHVWHSSFWQVPQGSKDLVNQALLAVYQSELGLGSPTALTEAALQHFGAEDVEALLHQLTARSADRFRDVAAFAPDLLSVAKDGDPVARAIVVNHGTALGDLASVAARRVGIDDTAFPFVLTGGVLRHPSTLLYDAIVERVRRTSPDMRPLRSRFEPVAGALFLALEAVAVDVDGAIQERFEKSMPPASLFST